MPVTVGTLQTILSLKDEVSDKYAKIESRLAAIEARQKTTSKVVKNENDKIAESYRKVAASLDPVVANTYKYEKAEKALSAALKAGIIDQDKHNKQLDLAKQKYLSANAATTTWRDEISTLGSKIGILNTNLGSMIGSIGGLTAGLAAALPLLVSIGVAIVGIGAGVVAFNFIKDSVAAGLETQKVIELLNNTLRSTGSYAEMSADQLVQLAEKYELLTGRQKEEIIAAETVLVRFSSLTKDSLPKAIEATLAFAKATGQTAAQAAKGLGPALEGSIRSLGALKDEGIVFTTSQRKTLQSLIDTGKVTEYQALLFDILKEKIGTVSNEFDKNLSRQINRAKIVGDEFAEGIATEVIPALEDIFDEIITSLGGWEKLQFIVTNVGRDVGNAIRQMVYGVVIAYHEWKKEQSELAAAIADTFSKALSSISSISLALSTLPLPGAKKWLDVAESTNRASLNLAKSNTELKKSANEHAISILRLTKGLVEHRLALEGDKKVYDSTGNSIDNVIGKNKEEEKTRVQLTKILKQQLEQTRYLNELGSLAKQGPQNAIERLKAEQKINDEHEYRLSLLKYEEQFSADIAKHLADQERKLKLMDRQIRLDLKASIELTPINVHPKILEQFNAIMKDTEEQLRLDTEAFDDFNQAQADWLEGFANDWIEFLEPARIKTQKEIAAIKAAVKEGYFGSDAKEAAKKGADAIAVIQSENLNNQLSGWTSFMSDLGNLVGGGFGRIMSQVAQAIQSIQAGQNMGTQLGGLLNASAGTTAMLGVAGIYVAAAKVAYDYFKSSQANRYSKGYDYAGITGMRDGQWSIGSGLDSQAKELSRQIQSTAKSFVDAIGGSIKSFASIEIQVRRDGKYFKSFVQGEMIGKFEDVNDAIKAAILTAFSSEKTKISGLSDLVQQGLSQALKVPDLDLEDAEGFLASLKEISELSWSDSAKQVSSTVNHFHNLLQELFKIEKITPAVLQGVEDIKEGIVSTFEQWRRSITGQEESPEAIRARQEREMRLFNTRKALEIANLKLEMETLEASKDILTGKANTTRQFFRIGLSELEGYESFVQARGQLAQAEIEIYGGIAEAIAAKLEALGAIIAELEAIPDIDIGELGRGGKGNRGGGDSDKDNVKDFISNRKFELSLIGLTDYKRSLKELDRQYDDLIKQAGKDKKLKEDLLILKDRELALLKEEENKRIANDIKDFVLPTSEFRSVRETAKKLIDDISNSPFGDKRKAESIGLVLNKLNEEITRLSRESAKGLLGDMISDFEKFGLDNVQLTEMRKASAILEHMLSVENYRIRIETLRAEGNISAEILKTLDASFALISGVDVSKWFDNTNIQSYQVANDNLAETTNKVDDALNDLAESFKSAKDDIKSLLIDIRGGELGIVSPMKSFDFVQGRYRDIIARAKSGDIVSYQESTSVTRDYIEALKKYKPSLAARELPNIQRDLQALLAMNQIHDDNIVYSERFASNQDRTNNIAMAGFNDLSNLSHHQIETQEQMLVKLSSIDKSQVDFATRLSQLEAIAMGNKK